MMPDIRSDIFVLTTSYRYTDEGTVVQFWGRSRKKNLIVLEDDTFDPYCYVTNLSMFDVKTLKNMIEVKDVTGANLKDRDGNSLPAWKVSVKKPKHVLDIKKWVSGKQKVWRGDILFPLNYMYDKGIGPRLLGRGTKHDGIFLNCKEIRNSNKNFVPKFRIMSMDSECFVQPEHKGNFICFGFYFNDRKYSIHLKGFDIKDKEDNTTYVFCDDEAQLIAVFVDLVEKLDPDIILTYNGDEWDWPLLEKRAQELGVPLALGRDGSNIFIRQKLDKDENVRHDVKITGRVTWDVWKMIRKYLKPVDEDLNSVGRLLKLGGKVADIDASRIDEHWIKEPERVISYCMQDAKLAYDIFIHESYLEQAMALAEASQLPLNDVKESISSRMVDSCAIRVFADEGYAIPLNNFDDDEEDDDNIMGAFVMEPTAGLHHFIGVLDFLSMYPTQIIKNNICYTTIVDEDDHPEIPDDACNIIEWLDEKPNEKGDVIDTVWKKHRFLKEPEGILPRIMKRLMKERAEAKAKAKEHRGQQRAYYTRLQDAIKILLNSFYGIMASSFYRFTDKRIGESITAFAREEIKIVIDMAEKMGYKAVFSDTDSVALDFRSSTIKETVRLLHNVSFETSKGGALLEPEKVYLTWFCHGRKKYYMGKVVWNNKEGDLETPEYDIKGYALKRRDSCPLQRKYLTRTVEAVLEEHNMDRFWKTIYEELQPENFRPAIEDLVFTKTVRDEEHYKYPERITAVKVVRKMKALGLPFYDGQRVRYIITTHKTPLEAEPVLDGRPMPVPDLIYYRNRIIANLAGEKRTPGIATVWNWDHKNMRNGLKTSSLEDF